jgi:hypothetical protein
MSVVAGAAVLRLAMGGCAVIMFAVGGFAIIILAVGGSCISGQCKLRCWVPNQWPFDVFKSSPSSPIQPVVSNPAPRLQSSPSSPRQIMQSAQLELLRSLRTGRSVLVTPISSFHPVPITLVIAFASVSREAVLCAAQSRAQCREKPCSVSREAHSQ